MKKKLLSILIVLVMVLSTFPAQVFATETGSESTDIPVVTGDPTPSDVPVPAEPAPTGEPDLLTAAPPAERVCEEGCILEGEEEHLENDGECLVWIPCTATEGCEGPDGHEGECYGAALYAGELPIHFFLASPGNITNPNGSYINYYGPSGSANNWDGAWTIPNIKQNASWSTMYTQNGIRNVSEESIVTQYIASYPNGHNAASFKDFGSVTINGTVYRDTEYEIKWVSIMCRDNKLNDRGMNCNQYSYKDEHIHVDGLLVKKVEPGEMEVFKTIPQAAVSQTAATSFHFKLEKMLQASLTTPPTSATAVDPGFAPLTLTATIPAGRTEAQIIGGSEITFGYYKMTEISNQNWQMASIALTDERGRTQTSEADALYICIAPNGTVQYSTAPSGPYTVMRRVAIENERKPVTVTYEWKVYNTNGTYTNLPAGAPDAPAPVTNVKIGSQYVYDTEYVTGTSFYDYDNGLLYTFHGWDTYSHSGTYNPNPGAGYYALDDGDTNAANNPTIEITAGTYIYGNWTVTELEPSAAHIAIEKVFIVDGVEMTPAEAEGLWFLVDTGIDRDGDGDSLIDVTYSMLRATGEYKIPVYQYDTPFVFTEYHADVPGYTRTTTIAVNGDRIEDYAINGDSVTVRMNPVYQGENIHLGTVTYTNSYTKNVGTPVSEYPVLTVLKTAADTQLAQDGVEFTLYSDEACTNAVAVITTDDGGLAYLNFADIENAASGTYYLKETAPLAGYHADPYVYAIRLTSRSTEELRNDQYVQITSYTLSVTLPDGSSATYTEGSNSLHIYNEPVLGSLNLSKTITGMADAHKPSLNAVVIVHGPITRDSQNSITAIGSTWHLELNSENSWAASLENLPLGEYLIHESFASVHGYTWSGVTYGDLETTVYNQITSGIFRVVDDTPIDLSLTNTYEEWTAADFYIKKLSENGTALAGAVFTLSSDEAGANVVMTKTTGADGYAHFDGFTVPDGQTSVTYYLRETKAPAGYYLSNQLYKVVIAAVTANGKTTYEPEITLVAGRSTGFDITTDLLTVVNYPVLGELTLTKAFTDGLVPSGLDSVSVVIGGPNGYSKTVELHNANGWSVTLENLALGEYTISEPDANVPGYTWDVSYSSTTVTLAEANPGMTAPGTEISGITTVTNRYTRNEEIFEVPTALTVKKVGEQGEPLAGAIFTLDRLAADGETVASSVSFTTGADGTVLFDLLYGYEQNDQPIDCTYILSETKAPEGYEATSATWTVTVTEDDGEIRWTLNENKNIFEGFWDWVVGNVSAGSFENGVLTVANVRSRGSLYIAKEVTDPKGLYADAEYSFTLDCSDDAFDKTFTLKAGENISIEDIPWGTTYTLTENTAGAAYTSAITDEANGLIWEYENRIIVRNTYKYTTHNNGLNLLKVDADDNAKVIPGAGFTLYADAELTSKLGEEVFSDENGALTLPIEKAGIYYLAETTTPAGYHISPLVRIVTAEEKAVVKNAGTADAVTELQMHIRVAGLTGTTENQIDYTYRIENTAIKALTVNVEKVWDDGGYHARPDSVKVTLYRDNAAFDTVTLSKNNNWRYSWTNLTDEYSWSVDEAEIPAEYVKSVTNEGNDWTVTNTRTPNPAEITVTKAWRHNGGKNLPESVAVVLYRDGEAHDTVILSGDNNWTHTWAELTDVSVWSVNEVDVPAGYTKEIITEDGLKFTIVNTRTINPVEVKVTKVWVASEGVIHPEAVEAVLYRNGEEYDTVVLNAENQWNHIWTGLTDEYTWNVDEKTVPEGYTKNVTGEGYDFTITNTKEFTYIDIGVSKVWYGAGVSHPDSVNVTLYRDGEEYDTVTLSAANGWRYTWEDLTDEFEWTVDEPSVPSGYNKTVRQDGWNFTVVNTHEDNPKTGDFSNLSGMGFLAAIGVVGFAITALMLLPRRKKEKN
ncbi:MAG: Cna B-type domain-containing protein [Ruminococcaceae bacterium]|nr:Cna B-type domain-containing protein [Oscillospiraceae bacterium]